MKLEPTSELISAYVDGELTADEQAVVEQAMRDDPDVRRMHDELRALRFTLQSLPRYEPEQDLTERIMRQAERKMLSGGDSARPERHDQESTTAVGLVDVPPDVATTSNPWRTWSVAISVIGTLAALLLFVLWLPLPMDQFGVARSIMPGESDGETVEREATAEMELQREEILLDDRLDRKLSEFADKAAAGEPADESTDSIESIARKEDRSLGRARALEDAMMGDADAAPSATSRPGADDESRYLSAMPKQGAVPKGGGASNTEQFYYESQARPEGEAAQSRADPKVAAHGARFESSPSRFGMPSRQFEVEAVEFQLADKEQLINRLDTDQWLYVQLDVSGSDTQWADGSSITWLDEKLRSPLSGGISVLGMQLGEALGITEGRVIAGDELVVAEGSADQIRAALTTLSELDGVEVKLATSSPSSWYARFRSGVKLGIPAEPDASRTAPSTSDFVESDGYAKTSPAADAPSKPANLPPAERLQGQQLGEREKRQQRSRGVADLAAVPGQGMPGRASGVGGGGMAGGANMPDSVPPPVPAASPRDAATRRAFEAPKLEQLSDLKRSTDEMKKLAKDDRDTTAESTPAGGAGVAKQVRRNAAGQDGDFGESPAKEKAPRTLVRGTINAGAPALNMHVPADKPATGPIVQVAKPRLVRILFRVRPPTVDAQAAQEAASTAEPTQDSGKDPDKSPEMEK
jgi:hypothetical protein